MTRFTASRLQTLLIAAFILCGTFAFISQNLASPRRRSCGWKARSHILHAVAESGEDWLSQISPESQLERTEQDDDDDEPPEDLGNIQIPSTGVSVTDELEKALKDKFESELVPITGMSGVAQIVTIANDGIIEPVRYLVSLSPPNLLAPSDDDDDNKLEKISEEQQAKITKTSPQSFVLVDIPPFSDKLLANMRKFMRQGGRLVAMVITSRDAIHYDDAPAVFTTRRSDLDAWTAAFPDAQVIGYRLDIPRDCREMITQRLDGYGPWALEEDSSSGNVTFVETGRPLTYEEWDEDITKKVMDEGETPPDDNEESDDDLYTPEAIRGREEGKRLLAVYTPGHTFGSLTYIFPETQVCCSGYTIPVEDDRYDESIGTGGGGPALDYRGYITTSRGGMSRMMESARNVVDTYSDRFTSVLPSRGDPLFVGGSAEDKKKILNDIIDQYDKIGKIYEQLGITSQGE